MILTQKRVSWEDADGHGTCVELPNLEGLLDVGGAAGSGRFSLGLDMLSHIRVPR
jgi:hypothetical protein